jgi:major membrane immunogen (membrane-anchored lipoprotein)
MKYVLIIIVGLLSACNFKKVSNVRINNNNNYAVAVSIYANNIMHEAKQIGPNSKYKGLLDFTNISKETGTYLVVLKNLETGKIDSFMHGEIIDGTLANYTDVEVNGGVVSVRISE